MHVDGGARINPSNPTPDAAQDVIVAAANDYYHLGVAATLALGGSNAGAQDNEAERARDIATHVDGRSPGERDGLGPAEDLAGLPHQPVRGAKVVTPFQDAVRFVDREACGLNADGLELV